MSEYGTKLSGDVSNERPARPWDLFNPSIHKLDRVATWRLEICRACPEFFSPTEQCKICKCFMVLKTKLPHASCPQGIWTAVEDDGADLVANKPDNR